MLADRIGDRGWVIIGLVPGLLQKEGCLAEYLLKSLELMGKVWLRFFW